MSIFGLLGRLESQGVWDTMTKEVVGINAPKIAVTRTNTERLDVAVSEIGNTIGAFGTGYLLDQALGKTFKSAQAAGGNAARWAVLGRSGAMFSAIFAIMWAMPFIRNYITAKRTGSVKFTDVIGAKGLQKNPQEDVQGAIQGYRNRALAILGLGALGVLAAAGGALLAIRRGSGLGVFKGLFGNETLARNLLLKNGSFGDFGGMKALLFWGVPAYGGWIQASRDPYEKKEQLLKFGNFVACFFGPQLLFDKYFHGKFKNLLPEGVEATYKGITEALKTAAEGPGRARLQEALKFWKVKSLGGLLTSIVLLGVMPPLINIWLTGQRVRRDAARQQQQAATQPLLAQGLRVRKSFAQWGARSAQA